MEPDPSTSQGRKYKSRKERPCDACRRRKVCCIRQPGDEACSLCRTSKQTCSYDQGPTPRKRRPTAAPLALSGIARVANLSSSSTVLPPTAPTRASALASTSTTTWPASTTSTDHERPQWIGQYVGLSGDLDPFVLRHFSFGNSQYYMGNEWACYRASHEDTQPAMFSLVPEDHLEPRPTYYPPNSLLDAAYPLHHELLTSYFEVIHTSYPLLDPVRFTKGNRIDLPLLASMYSLALPFCTPARHVMSVPLTDFVFQALPVATRAPKLEIVETALLFLHRHTQTHRVPTMPGLYAEIGNLVGMSHDLGLHIDPSRWKMSSQGRSRRKRLWWAVFMADKWAALGLGRPSYIHDEDFTVLSMSLEDVPATMITGAALPQTCSRMFVAMSALTQILSSVLSTFYTLRAADTVGAAATEEIVRIRAYFELQLNEFKSKYLRDLQHINDIFLDPTGTLWLAYHTVHIAIYKALLRILPATSLIHQQIRLQAKTTITEISRLLENLQVARVRAFWWSPLSRDNFSMAGSFMFSMLLSSVTEIDIDYWSNEITRYRRLLDMHSLSFDITKLAAVRMSALANVGLSSAARSTGFEGVATGADFPSRNAFYRDFGLELRVT